jgi:peptide-methionine (S)-S-oxide reductase
MSVKQRLISAAEALAGRSVSLEFNPTHYVNQQPMIPPFPAHYESVYFAMGCFWGVERLFWHQVGVHVTAVGYQGGFTPNPTYQEVCSGLTAHAESVLVVFDPTKTTFAQLLKVFWENHDPAQGARQGNDIGTQYRSMIFTTTDTQLETAKQSLKAFQQAMSAQKDSRVITTEISAFQPFYYAEEYHQQYLAKNPEGYCGIGGIGVCLPPNLS